jgi:CcmD family protein
MQTSPPDNGGYMIAAYVIVSLLVLAYAWSLARRAKREG